MGMIIHFIIPVFLFFLKNKYINFNISKKLHYKRKRKKRAGIKNMNGLEMILKKIEDDNSKVTKGILDKSIEEANKIIQESENNANIEAKNILLDSENKSKMIEENEKSSCEKFIQNEILKEKNQFIENAIKESISETINSKQYFSILKLLIIKYAHKKENGELILSKRDLENLPSDFLKEINKELKKESASITLSKETADYEGGFILKYDRIEENCTFSELIEEKKTLIYDTLQKLIS